MFKRIIDLWNKLFPYTPKKEIVKMTDQECMDEYTKYWNDSVIFELKLSNSEEYRMYILGFTLKSRGYDVIGSNCGVYFEKRK